MTTAILASLGLPAAVDVAAHGRWLEKVAAQNEVFVWSKQSDAAQTRRGQIRHVHVLNETLVAVKDNERHMKEKLKFFHEVLPLKDKDKNADWDDTAAAQEGRLELQFQTAVYCIGGDG